MLDKGRSLLWLFLVFVLCGPVHAQTIDYNLRIYAPGASAPISVNPIAGATVLCNQAAPTTTSTTNPNKAIFDDPSNAGRVCIYTDDGSGPLLAKPVGFVDLEGTMTMRQGTKETAESNRAPFDKRPGAPANVRLVR